MANLPRTFAARLFSTSMLFLVLAGCSREKPTLSVVLIMIDTLRADQIGLDDPEQGVAPRILQLAREGTRFTKVFAASPWTGPSVASIVTGKYPDEVGIRDLRDPLPLDAITLAERFKAEDYRTGAVVSNAMAGPAYGLDQGYDAFFYERYKGAIPAGPAPSAPRPSFTADRVTDRAIAWLKEAGDEKPFFFYVHYTDPHEPYMPPAAWRKKFLAGRTPLDDDFLAESAFTRIQVSEEMLDRILSYYRAEVAFTDHEVGRLLEQIPPDTLVVLIGDHGEEFMEHGFFLHGQSLYQELLDVPLIFKGPGIPAGVTADEPVSHVDIVPTILDLAGMPAEKRLPGMSLEPIFRNPDLDSEPRLLFSVLESRRYRWDAVIHGPWKLHLVGDQKNQWLSDLDQDPGETKNAAAGNYKIIKPLIHAIEARKSRAVAPSVSGDPAMDRQREEELRAIGYIK
jgi:arylsulfatase A-like enzyme